jgi:hypothetical protein
MTTNFIPSRAQLLSEGPESCLNFVRDQFPSKFDWLRLAEGAATKAASHITLSDAPQGKGLDWLRVAVELYELMADHPTVHDPASRLRLSLPALGLRALAIKTWGARDDDILLSSDELSRRFLSLVKVSPQQLKEDHDFPRTDDIRDALELTRYMDPLWDSNILKERLSKVFEYCDSARIARENARTKFVSRSE